MENIETIVIDSDAEENSSDMELDSGNDILPKDNLTSGEEDDDDDDDDEGDVDEFDNSVIYCSDFVVEIIAEEKKNAGNDHYKAQNYQTALRYYSDAIAICPETPAYYGNRAACHMMLADYKAALEDSRRAVQIDKTFAKGYMRIAKCCVALGDIVAAEQAIKRILELDAKSTIVNAETQSCKQLRIHEDTARACYQSQDFRTAVYHADSALKIAPACLKFKLLKAECLALLGRITQANDLAVSCMQTDSSNAEAVYVRGLCLYYNDNLDKGLMHFARALALDPDNANARAMRIKAKGLKEKKEKGNELFNGGKFREAYTVYTEALAIDPRNKDINSKLYYNRALVNMKIGNVSDAIKDCSGALEANANYLKPLLLRARCQNDMKNFEEAVKDYETALKMEKTAEIKYQLKEAKLALKKSKRKDYYKILGIDKNATDHEIKKAYRKRALVHHPDRHANASVEEQRKQEGHFKEVGEAYTILSDSQKRTRYDTGQDIEEEQGDVDPNNIYRQFFQYYQTDQSQGPSFSFQF